MTTTTAPRPRAEAPPIPAAEIARLLITGRDGPGIVAAVSSLLRDLGANIISLDQFSSDADGGGFFQRTEFHLPSLAARIPEVESAIAGIADELGLRWSLALASQRKRIAILASTTDHCLLDLLWRERRGELNTATQMVISNHADLARQVRDFGVPYVHVPVGADKSAAEAQHLELLRGNVDLIVLARYMQIISTDFLEAVGVPIINIHHSFLPAFIGAGPYRKAKERGVKLIGATAHYVTAELDEGPIIEQDVVRVTHAHDTQDLMRRGADVERAVLARAVQWHCEDRVLRDGNTTIVFP